MREEMDRNSDEGRFGDGPSRRGRRRFGFLDGALGHEIGDDCERSVELRVRRKEELLRWWLLQSEMEDTDMELRKLCGYLVGFKASDYLRGFNGLAFAFTNHHFWGGQRYIDFFTLGIQES